MKSPTEENQRKPQWRSYRGGQVANVPLNFNFLFETLPIHHVLISCLGSLSQIWTNCQWDFSPNLIRTEPDLWHVWKEQKMTQHLSNPSCLDGYIFAMW